LTLAPSAIALPEVERASSTSSILVAQALTSTTATVVDADPREDTVRLRLADGSIRMFSLAAQKQSQLALAPGAEVMLTMNGDRIVTMMRMVSVQPAEQVEATVVELTPRLDRIRVRLADGSIRLLSLSARSSSLGAAERLSRDLDHSRQPD